MPRDDTHVQFGEAIHQICLLVLDPGGSDRENVERDLSVRVRTDHGFGR